MKFNAPKNGTWLIAVILGIVGIIGQYQHLGLISDYSFLLVVAGFVILTLATMFKGL